MLQIQLRQTVNLANPVGMNIAAPTAINMDMVSLIARKQQQTVTMRSLQGRMTMLVQRQQKIKQLFIYCK